ncbi:phosphomannomutase [Sinorhizobium meliloti]|uniref:phosphomannomutase n=1 Tax=Rhizobium meliloti TaxID=382 RepID=UPI001297D0F6|nr:phosphomannomutase [Sinorhizobium meliloti]MDW9428075.1 phosphomannomutase [Sinorhizobium meliloti]MDX0018180.1 phosphomannomutase [Sinorhizobium meliloti]MQV82650.1 phosphomannomutase [Sinorhizobium meliloti]
MKFGTSGLRGLVTDLEGRASAIYAQAFAIHLIRNGLAKTGDQVLVGRDFRPSSPSIAATCIGALERAGLMPLDCGAQPTPALALYGLKIGAASLMITGSHIPADRNGIKFYRADGEIDKQDELQISAIAAEMAGAAIDVTPGSAPDRSAAARDLFSRRVMSILPEKALCGLKVGVYQHSTVARDLLVEALMHYGAEVVELGFSADFIPVDTEAVSSETIALLRKWTHEHGLDAIASADGDGDRPLLSDERGEPLRGDLLGLISSLFLEADVVVTPVTSNSGIEANGTFLTIRTRVGSPFVIAGMREAVHGGHKKVMGFEANGGLLTASAFSLPGGTLSALPTRDSFLPVLAPLWFAAQKMLPLSQLAAAFSMPFARAGRLANFPVETSGALMTYLRQSDDNLADFLAPLGAIARKSDVDGLRVTFEDRRVIHLRPSGNAPEMRCYIEAATEHEAQTLLNDGLALIRRWESRSL